MTTLLSWSWSGFAGVSAHPTCDQPRGWDETEVSALQAHAGAVASLLAAAARAELKGALADQRHRRPLSCTLPDPLGQHAAGVAKSWS